MNNLLPNFTFSKLTYNISLSQYFFSGFCNNFGKVQPDSLMFVISFQSLKKEVDWGGGGDEKIGGEASVDYRHSHESVSNLLRLVESTILLISRSFKNLHIRPLLEKNLYSNPLNTT